jgi:5'-nucleotidase
VTLQILLTNDDGITAPGIAALRAALEGLGEITTIAPDHDTSAVARGITVGRALRLRPAEFGAGWPGLACDGTPADCVRVALLGVECPPPDLVVAGVNLGANLGADVTYSGTVGAALEAALRGVPALAFSIDAREPRWLSEDTPVLREIVVAAVAHGLPPQTILNVNLPDLPPADLRGIEPARLGGASCHDRVMLEGDGAGPAAAAGAGPAAPAGAVREYFLPCDPPAVAADTDTDIDVVARGAVAVTPLRYDLVHSGLLAGLAGWGLGLGLPRA